MCDTPSTSSALKQKLDDDDEDERGAKKKIKILNDDCLEKIFTYLDLTNLVNVADSDVAYTTAARLAYKRLYGKKMLCISNAGHDLSICDSDNTTLRSTINVTVKSFLRNFGVLVSTLIIDYSNPSEREDVHHWREAEKAILKHCLKTLTGIELLNCRGKLFEEIRSPFEKVKKLRITGSPDDALFPLSKWFPKITYIKLDGNATISSTFIRSNFRPLEEVEIFDNSKEQKTAIETNIRTFLVKHPQITFLSIRIYGVEWCRCIFDFWEFLSHNLDLVDLKIVNENVPKSTSSKKIHFKSLESFYYITSKTYDFPDDVSLTFEKLEEFFLMGIKSNEKLMEIFNQNKNIKVLYIDIFKRLTCEKLLQIVTNRTQLHIKFNSPQTSSNEFIDFLTRCKPNDLKISILFRKEYTLTHKSIIYDTLSVASACTLRKIESSSEFRFDIKNI